MFSEAAYAQFRYRLYNSSNRVLQNGCPLFSGQKCDRLLFGHDAFVAVAKLVVTAHQVTPSTYYRLDTFFSGNNEARLLFAGSNDLSLQAESNDTHHWGASFLNIFIFLGGAGILQLWGAYLRGFSTFGSHYGAPRK